MNEFWSAVVPRPRMTASARLESTSDEHAAHVVRRGRLLQRDVDARAALEVDALVEPVDDQRAEADQDRHAGDREPEHLAAGEVHASSARAWASAPMKATLLNHLKLPRMPSIARVAGHGGEHRDQDAEGEQEGEALDRRRRGHEQHRRRDQRHRVRVDDRAEALRVARGDGRADGLPRAHLLLDAFEDDDVRVRRDADRQDHAGDARQGHRHRDREDHAVEQRREDQQRDVGDEAEEPVEDEHVDHHDRPARDAREQALVRATPCRASPRPGSWRAAVNSTGSEPDCSTSAMSLASCALSRPVIWALPPLMPSGLSRKSIVGIGLELAVEDDREALQERLLRALRRLPAGDGLLVQVAAAVGELVRDVLEDVAAAAVEVHRDDRRAGLRVEVGPRLVQVGARQQLGPRSGRRTCTSRSSRAARGRCPARCPAGSRPATARSTRRPACPSGRRAPRRCRGAPRPRAAA